jgi:hypothetical protein
MISGWEQHNSTTTVLALVGRCGLDIQGVLIAFGAKTAKMELREIFNLSSNSKKTNETDKKTLENHQTKTFRPILDSQKTFRPFSKEGEFSHLLQMN